MRTARLEAFSDGVLAIVITIMAGLAFVNQWISDALYVAVATMWLVPDRRIEKTVGV